MSDDVAGEHGVVLLDSLRHYFEQVLHILHKVSVKILHYAADAVVVESHASAAGLLKDVQYRLALAKSVEQHCGCTQVHTECSHEQEVG